MANKIPTDPVKAAGLAVDALEYAVRAQLETGDPAHEDFYAFGAVLDQMLRHLDDLAGVLARQVSRYGDNRILRDDRGADPAGTLADAATHLNDVRTGLVGPQRSAGAYWSAIGRIGVAVDPNTTGD